MCNKVGHNQDCECLEAIDLDFEEHEYDETYEEEYYAEDEEDGAVEQRVAEETWGLDPTMPLAREAADWYLLMMLWLDEKDDSLRFVNRTDRLAETFKDYADMVVGGELRYTLGHVPDPDYNLANELHEGLRYEINGQRSEAWEAWFRFRNKHKTNALHWAEEAFKAFGSNTYGGDKWAYITRVIRMYETNEISPVTFVDMCWGLEHNGGQFFGKLWNTYGLKNVLDANVNDEIRTLLVSASPSVYKIYTEVNGDVLPA
jgi:hypothetical protein